MNSMKALLLSLVCVALLAGCTTAATPHYYLLDVVESVESRYPRVSHARLPGYLQSGNLVIQVGPHELQMASFRFWAESLEQGVARVFDKVFSSAVPQESLDMAEVKVLIDVKRLHGNLQGQVMLVADWRVSSACQPLAGSYRNTITQSESGYDALVAAQVRLISLMAVDVKQRWLSVCE